MSLTIPDSFRNTFADSFKRVVQQSNSRLRKVCRVRTGLTGISQEIKHVNSIEAENVTGQRYKKVVLEDLSTESRWYYPDEFQKPTGESKWDENALAPTVMPGGVHIAEHQAAFHRASDAVIMAAIVGDMRTGKNGENTTALPAGQIVPVDFVHTGSDTDAGLTVPKILEAIRILKKNEAWNEDVRAMGEKLFLVLDADEEMYLRQEANKPAGDRLFSTDFGPPAFDENGSLTYWLGVHFVCYNVLPTASVTGAGGTVSAKQAALLTSSAMEFGIWGDFSATVDVRPDLSNAIQFLSQYRLGAGREQDKKVTIINCLNA